MYSYSKVLIQYQQSQFIFFQFFTVKDLLLMTVVAYGSTLLVIYIIVFTCFLDKIPPRMCDWHTLGKIFTALKIS